ncbi:hypothetical protein ACN47E_008341 [Coniothyrium glycines]
MSGHLHSSQLPHRISRTSISQPSCRPARVEKPKSHQNSPRTMERRKTTTENKLYATLDDHYKMMFGIAPEESIEDRPQLSRPVSWHPSSAQFQSSRPTKDLDGMPQQSRQHQHSPSGMSYHGSDFYSLSTRNSMLEPMPNVSNHSTGHRNHRYSEDSHYSWLSGAQQTPSHVISAVTPPSSEHLPWYLQQWALKNQAYASQNESNDFLPIQHPGEHDVVMEDEGEKLVALGLYDAPEPSLSWGGLVEGTGKGLKLEETWQPPEDEDDEQDADDASSEASVDEPSPPLPAVNQHTPHLQMPVNLKAQHAGSMEGQSFFFDEDETVSKEWWFHQLKQPSMPVQDTGLGYGWL